MFPSSSRNQKLENNVSTIAEGEKTKPVEATENTGQEQQQQQKLEEKEAGATSVVVEAELELSNVEQNVEIIRLLCKSNARVNIKDAKTLTPLHYACRANNYVFRFFFLFFKILFVFLMFYYKNNEKPKESSRSAHVVRGWREHSRSKLAIALACVLHLRKLYFFFIILMTIIKKEYRSHNNIINIIRTRTNVPNCFAKKYSTSTPPIDKAVRLSPTLHSMAILR